MKSVIICLAVLLAAMAPPQDEEILMTPLRANVRLITGGGGNITVVAGPNGLAVVDTFYTLKAAREARRLIGEFSSQPLLYVVNTHYHGDHTFGNQVFSDAPIIAHKNAADTLIVRYEQVAIRNKAAGDKVKQLEEEFRKAVESDADAAKRIKEELDKAREEAGDMYGFVLTPPDQYFEEGMELDLGEVTLRLLYLGPAHTSGDLVILVPQSKLLVAGDLIFNRRIPYIDVDAGADVANWIAALDSLLAMQEEYSIVVPGHGEAGGAEIIQEQRDYLSDLLEAVKAAKSEGKTLEQAKAEIALGRYSDYGGYDRLHTNVEACWKYLDRVASEQEGATEAEEKPGDAK